MDSKTVYVGDLSAVSTEDEVLSLFSTQGPVQSIKVVRTDNQPGYAYVNYYCPNDASKAVNALKFAELNGQQLRVMLYDPFKLRASKQRRYNVIVKNLPQFVDNKGLYDTFEVFGKILSAKVAVDDNKNSRGFGYVCYQDKAAMKKAIEIANNTTMNGCVLKVARHERKDVRALKPQPEPKFTNVYIKNFDFSEVELRTLLESFGKITSFCLPQDEHGTLKGVAFCNFESHDAAKLAVNELHGKSISELRSTYLKGSENAKAPANAIENSDANIINDTPSENDSDDLTKPFDALTVKEPFYIQRAQSKVERSEALKNEYRAALKEGRAFKRNLYVVNLPASTTDNDIHELFSAYGSITNYKLKTDATSGLKFAYVCFSSPEEAEIALLKTNDTVFDGHKISVAFFKTRKERIDEKQSKPHDRPDIISEKHRSTERRSSIGGDLYGMVLSMADVFINQWPKMGVTNEYAFADRITKLLMERPFSEVRNMISLNEILSQHIVQIMKDLDRSSISD